VHPPDRYRPAGQQHPGARAIGSFDEVQEHFHARQWTDGLPIVPPTIDRVREMLTRTPLSADHVIGVLPPESREITVWNVAVTGVMAGCRPEYMPLLVAAVEAIADPYFRLEDAGATPAGSRRSSSAGRISPPSA
jgi:hypothetical protein